MSKKLSTIQTFDILTNNKRKKLKVSKYDDSMMEDGTLNINHWSLKSDKGMSIPEYNAHLSTSDGGL